MSLVVSRTRPASQGSCAAVQHSRYVLWNLRPMVTRVSAPAVNKGMATLLPAQDHSTAVFATSAGPSKSSRGDARFRLSTEPKPWPAAVAEEAAESTPQATLTANSDAATSLSARKIGILSAEFGPEALQVLRSAAAAASQAHAAAAESRRLKMLPSTPTADDLEPQLQRVLVTEQYLMMGLLQQQPEAVEIIAQHTVLDQTSADLQHNPSFLIQEKLAGSGSGGSGEAAGRILSDEVPAGELQLSAQVLRVLNDALTITRQQDQPVVLWPSLMWGLMRVPNAHTAYEQFLGAKLLSADVREQACLLVEQQAGKAELGSSTNSSSSSMNVAHCKLQSWMDSTLDQAFAGAQQALEQCKWYEAAHKAALAISSAAEAGYRPSVAWLEAAWGLIKEVVTSLYQNGEYHDADCTELSDAQHHALNAGVAAAAYGSVVHLRFTGPDMFCAIHEVVYTYAGAQYHSLFSDVWLQLVIAAAADPLQSIKSQRKRYLQYSRSSEFCRLGTQGFSPAKGLSIGFLPILLQDTKLFGMSAFSSTDPTIGTRLCQLLLCDMPCLGTADVCTLAEHASAIWKGSSPPQQQQWLKVLESFVHRVCSQSPESVSTAQLLRAYAAVFCLPRDKLVNVKLQLMQRLVTRSNALSSHDIVSKIGRVCEDTMKQCPQLRPELPATASECQLTSVSEKEGDIQPEIAAELVSMLSVLALARQGTEVMSVQHLDALLQTIIAQHRDIESSGSGDPPPMQALVEVLLPAAESAVARGTGSSAAAAAHLASLLNTVQQLPLYFSVDKINQLVVSLPGWLPQLEPEQLAQVMRFVAKQQLQLGRKTEGLALSKDILWHNLDSHNRSAGVHKQAWP